MYRIIINTKDVCQLTGKGAKYSRALMKKIYQHYNKNTDLPLTFFEVCDYLKIDAEKVKHWMR